MLYPDALPEIVEHGEVPVRRGLVPEHLPQTVHRIQFWVVGREVVEINLRVVSQERIHGLALVPPSAVDVEVDPPIGAAVHETLEEREEARRVATGDAEQAMPAAQRGHPPEAVQALPVRAGGGDADPSPAPHPAPPEAGVERKPRLVGEHEDGPFPAQDGLEFFLSPRRKRRTPWLLAWTRR